MGKYYAITSLLIMMIAVSSAQDWLGGGYVGRGDNQEVGQYYMDPIFYSDGNNHYVSPDPAVSQMQASLNYPLNGHYLSADPAIRQMQESLDYSGNRHYASSDPAIRQMQESLDRPRHFEDGHWQLWLSDGTSFDLILSQSGNSVLGYGLMTFGGENKRVTISGSIYGRNLELEITPDYGIKSYTVSIDIGYLPKSGTYTAYGAGAYPQSGYVNAYRLAG